MYDLSDEALCNRWIENPYFQFFCGEEFFQHRLPFDWRSDAINMVKPELLRRPQCALELMGMGIALMASRATADCGTPPKAQRNKVLERIGA
jgi:hypothetical protein